MKFFISALFLFSAVNPLIAKRFPSFDGAYQGTIYTVAKNGLSYSETAIFKKRGIFTAEGNRWTIVFQKRRQIVFKGFYGGFFKLTGSYKLFLDVIRFSAYDGGTSVKGRIRKSKNYFFLSVHRVYTPPILIEFTSPTPTPTPEPTP